MHIFGLELCDQFELVGQQIVVVFDFHNHVGFDVRFAAGNGLDQCIVYENVLLFGLHQEISLVSYVPQETEHIQDTFLFDLLEHCV